MTSQFDIDCRHYGDRVLVIIILLLLLLLLLYVLLVFLLDRFYSLTPEGVPQCNATKFIPGMTA